jgi:uncharacterized protein (TIGR02302 family)
MSKPETPPQNPVERRLDRLVRLATAAAFWEGLWRGLIPPLVVIGAFLCVSWLGLWLDVPHIGRIIGVAIFAVLFALSTFGLWRLVPLSRREALRRIDKASGLTHRPASVLDDTLATAGRDPSTDALWALHRKRAETEAARLRPGRPSPRAVELDRYAVRAGIVVALVACAIVAGPQRYARVAAAFDFGEGPSLGTSYRLDAWIDPPPYTGKPPVLIDLASDSARDMDHPRTIAAPAGSVVIIRSSGGEPAEIETTGPLLPPPAKPLDAGKAAGAKTDEAKTDDAAKVPGDSEKRLVLHGDSRLVLRHDGSLRGIFDLTAIADKPPTIALREVPKANARGSLTLAYTTSDDYGVSKAEVLFSDPMIDGTPIDGPPLVAAPKGELALPGVSGGIGDAETTLDLSDSPWAGTQVKMVLVAHDEGGNEGRSEPVTITLPEKPFTNPVARALVEQRRELVLNPHRKSDVIAALDAMMIAPDAFGTNASVYLGLRFASTSLDRAQTDQEQLAVADFLWEMAQQLENGDLTEAEKALRAAEKELRDALDHHASPEEIQKLTKNLQAAMDKFLKELAQQQQKQDQQAQNQQQGRNSKSVSQKDLQKLIDKLEQQAKSGNREEAKKALDELQDILENLKTAKRQKADPQARAMAEGLNQLDQAMRDQQELRDQTYKKGQQGQQQGQQQQDEDQQMPGGNDPGQSQGMNSGPGPKGQQRGRKAEGQEQDGQSEGSEGGPGKSGRGQGGNLQQRQQELRDRLAQIQKKLKQAGEGQGELDEAGKAMREAEQALREGESGNSDAVEQQGKALDAMRRGAKKLADAMSQQGDPNGQANGENDGGTGSREGQQSQSDDPLGRPRGGNNTLNSLSRFDPLGVPAAQRAQRVLEELRRRLGDPSRAQEEIDYLERLLRSY